jgi:hypothetical protein
LLGFKFLIWLRKKIRILFYNNQMGCLCPKPINSNRPSEPFPPRNAVNVVERDCGSRYDRQVHGALDVDADDSMMSKFQKPEIPKHRSHTNDHSSERRIGTPPKNYKKT